MRTDGGVTITGEVSNAGRCVRNAEGDGACRDGVRARAVALPLDGAAAAVDPAAAAAAVRCGEAPREFGRELDRERPRDDTAASPADECASSLILDGGSRVGKVADRSRRLGRCGCV